jgi:hypothetical protein
MDRHDEGLYRLTFGGSERVGGKNYLPARTVMAARQCRCCAFEVPGHPSPEERCDHCQYGYLFAAHLP